MKKGLVKLALITAPFLFSGCSNNKEYHYNGELLGKHVKFYERIPFGRIAVLRVDSVNKRDLIKFYYIADKDLKVRKVRSSIVRDGSTFFGDHYKLKNLPDSVQEKIQNTFDLWTNSILTKKQEKAKYLLDRYSTFPKRK